MRIIAAVLAAALAGVCVTPVRLRGWLWVLVIIASVVPWTDLQHHSHWWRVGWIPFLSPPVRLRDIIGNAALYVPFGLFFQRRSSGDRPRRLWLVLAGAFLLSIGTEASQSYSHSRFPSATDVTTNVLGAALGWYVASAWTAHRHS